MVRIKKRLVWEAFAGGDRNEVINQIKDAIFINDGCIVNSGMFSDLALSLNIEIEGNKISELHHSLETFLRISELKDIDNTNNEWTILMNISFSKGEGNLKMIIPEVPG